ncbi:hypothetical protein [Streptomyces sp. 3211]|uniref:hypothetical protein n=1 Tax=Streptomyces sp. 3211 TaxID=1964449 RepID=UPI0017AC9CF8|nr:hypothetical protein [Streptomyces sp. 3211]
MAAAAVATLLVAPSAQASPEDEANYWHKDICVDAGDGAFQFSIFYNSNLKGSHRNVGYNVWDFGGPRPLTFCELGASAPHPGSGQNIKNNAASAINFHLTYTANVYYNSGHKGAVDSLGFGAHNLNRTYNNNASFAWRG